MPAPPSTTTLSAAEAYSQLRSPHHLSEYEALTALRVAAEYGRFENYGVEVICNDANEADPRYTIFGIPEVRVMRGNGVPLDVSAGCAATGHCPPMQPCGCAAVRIDGRA